MLYSMHATIEYPDRPLNDKMDESTDILNRFDLLDVPTEIIAHLLAFVDRSGRFSVSATCKRLLDIIHFHVGCYSINVKSSECCRRLSGSPLLKNTKISFGNFPKASDHDLAFLTGINELSLFDNVITDEGLKQIIGVRILRVQYCSRITDAGIIPLVKNLKEISLCRSAEITSKGLKALSGIPRVYLPHFYLEDDVMFSLAGVHTIDLRETSLTDKGVSALAGVHSINLSYTKVTDVGISALAGVDTIDLTYTAVTDKGVMALVGVHKINLSYTKVTDRGVSAVACGIHKIHLSGCKGITGKCLKDLGGAHTINISYTDATDDWIVHLSRVHELRLFGCQKLTGECISNLKQKGVTIHWTND